MRKLVYKYISNEIKKEDVLAKLRDDAEFMLEVFRMQMKAIEFDNVSDRLKDDEDFVQKTKDIFSSDRDEYFSLAISLRNHRKKKEADKEDVNKPNEKKEKPKDQASKSIFKASTIKVETARPIVKKERVREKEVKEEKCEEDAFSVLVKRLPISEKDQKNLIFKYSGVSEEKKLLATFMVMDFLDQLEKDRPKSVRLLRSNNNKFYPHY